MQRTISRAAMVGAFVGLVLTTVQEADARGGRGGGGGFSRGGSVSMSRGGGGGGSGFSRAGNYSRPSGSYNRPSQLPARGGNRGNINSGNINRGSINTGNINRANINTGDVNINRNVHVDNGVGWAGGWRDYPIARGVAIGAVAGMTAAAIGSAYYALPPACSPYAWQSYTYYSCGSAYYRPQYQGDTIVYVVVPKPE